MSYDRKSTHYDHGGIEVLDVIKAKLTPDQFRGYLLGNAIKYALRANFKGSYERDLEKCAFYASAEEMLAKQDAAKVPAESPYPADGVPDVSLSGVAILSGEQDRNGAVCVRCGAEFIYTGVKPDFCGHCMRKELDERESGLCQNCGHDRGDGDEWCSRCGQHYD